VFQPSDQVPRLVGQKPAVYPSTVVRVCGVVRVWYKQHHTHTPDTPTPNTAVLPVPLIHLRLDTSDIKTTCPSEKLEYHNLGPYLIERCVG
jgi:hypothetical protein